MDREKHQRMWKDAMAVFEGIKPGIRLIGLLRWGVPDGLEGESLTIQEHTLTSSAFYQLSNAHVERYYAYLLHLQDNPASSKWDRLSDRLFADIWETAFVDAGRDLVRTKFVYMESETGEGNTLSDSFGPGYYGMDPSQVETLYHLLAAEQIGVTLLSSGMMVPHKSCTGLYLAVEDPTELPRSGCSTCHGNSAGCAFCGKNPKIGHR